MNEEERFVFSSLEDLMFFLRHMRTWIDYPTEKQKRVIESYFSDLSLSFNEVWIEGKAGGESEEKEVNSE